jgi:hypothetical protein
MQVNRALLGAHKIDFLSPAYLQDKHLLDKLPRFKCRTRTELISLRIWGRCMTLMNSVMNLRVP